MQWFDHLRQLFGEYAKVITATKDSSTSTSGEGVRDPLGGMAVCTPETRGPYVLANDGKLYTPLCSGGYPPEKTVVKYPGTSTVITEITGAGVALGSQREGVIYKPAAATLAVGGVTLPASAVDLVIPFACSTSTTFTSGVASCWAVHNGWSALPITATSR